MELNLQIYNHQSNKNMSSNNLLLQQNKFIQYKIKILMLIYSILKEINNTLNESIEDKFNIYFRYSNNIDLFTRQNIILELGKTLIEIGDKLK